MYGEDAPFEAWSRLHPEIDSRAKGIAALDVDYIYHKYKENVDGMGSRVVHLMLCLETKTRGGLPPASQLQSLFFMHQILNRRMQVQDVGGGNRKAVWHFGYFVLSMPGEYPGEQTDSMNWCHFNERGDLVPVQICEAQLLGILGFTLHPVTVTPFTLRRHHKTRHIEIVEQTPLGFSSERVVAKRS